MSVRFLPAAREDLLEIHGYIFTQNPARAGTFIDEIVERCERIADYPQAAPLRPEIAEDIRAVPFGNYLILYSEQGGEVTIERLWHGARDPRNLIL